MFSLLAKWRQPPWRTRTPLPRPPAWPWPRRRSGCCARRAWTRTARCRPSAPGQTEQTQRQTPRRRWDSTLSSKWLSIDLKIGWDILALFNLSKVFWHIRIPTGDISKTMLLWKHSNLQLWNSYLMRYTITELLLQPKFSNESKKIVL